MCYKNQMIYNLNSMETEILGSKLNDTRTSEGVGLKLHVQDALSD